VTSAKIAPDRAACGIGGQPDHPVWHVGDLDADGD
jgi:hypothetical protein